MPFQCYRDYYSFAEAVRSERRFLPSDNGQEFLQAVLQTGKMRSKKICKGKALWRAQAAFDKITFDVGDGPDWEPIPCCRKRLIPDPEKVTEGRANPQGIPVFYCANNKEVAMSEMRPWRGCYLTVGCFSPNRDLKVVNLSGNQKNIYDYLRLGKDCLFVEENELIDAVWATIDEAFLEPVGEGKEAVGYAPTQIITELFKNEGFDGIAYDSAYLEKGINFALFDPGVVTLKKREIHEAKNIVFDFSPCSETSWC